MKKVIAIFFLCLAPSLFHAQKPKSIDDALRILQKNCSDSLKDLIKSSELEDLHSFFYPWDGENRTLLEFTSHQRPTKYQKYYEKQGILYRKNIENITLAAFRRQLNGWPINHDSIVAHYFIIDQQWKYEDDHKFTVDSINGIYIPLDLEDCFVQIDSFWDDSTKTAVKEMTEDDFAAWYHHGFGTWMRNNWQLWGGSRLSQFFHERKVHHPDNMSWVIMISYHRYLNDEEIKLEEQLKRYRGK